jgi:hypothetical protein
MANNLYTHDQFVGAATWTVAHGLGSLIVTVEVVIDHNGKREKVLPSETKVIDANTVQVEFLDPQTGTARVVANG